MRCRVKKHFGVEIEFTGVKRCEVVKALENFFESEAKEYKSVTTDDNYCYHKIMDSFGNHWTVKRDRSIKPQVYASVFGDSIDEFEIVDLPIDSDNFSGFNEYMVELVSPVLTSETLPLLFSIVDIIKALGGIVNSTCGIHVHVDNLPLDSLVNLYKRFVIEQDEIFNAFNVEDWRAKKYCKKYDSSLDIPSDIISEDDFLVWIWENYRDKETEYDVEVRSARSMRYYALNFYSLIQHHTVEYRLFNATLDKVEIARILKWVINFTYPYEQLDDIKLVLEPMLLMEMKK